MARPEDLTIDFKKLLRMTVRDRVQMAQSREGPSYLAALTPTQYAMLFPEYYRKDLPDIGLTAATSGATPLGTVSGEGPSDGKMPTAVPTAPSREPPTTGGKEAGAGAPAPGPAKSTVAKESWQQRLMREAEERKTGRTAPSVGEYKGGVSTDTRGRIDSVSFYKTSVAKIRGSRLDGFVPKDGAKFGIVKGTPEEWARLFTMIGQQESKLQKAEVNPDGTLKKFRSTPSGEKSYGPLQFNKGEYGLKTWEDVNDPEKNIEALIRVTEMWSLKSGVISGQGKGPGYYDGWGGMSAYFGSLRRPNEILQHGDWFEKSVGSVVKEEATKVLPPTTDDTGKVVPGQTPGRMAPTTAEPLTALPEGLDPGIVEHYKTLKEDEQKKLLESMTGVTPGTINQYYREDKDSATPQAVREKTGDIISGKGHPEDQFGVTGTAAQRGLKKVDPRLVKIMEETAKDFPLRVRLFSGIRSKGAHGKGLATDIQIFDESGKPLSSYQTSQTANIYAMFAERARAKQMELFPELDKSFVWGGGWAGMKKGGGAGKYGAADFMDFRIGHSSQSSMRAYKWGEGWQKGYEYYTDNDFLGIGNRPITEEDYAKLEGFILSDEQERIQRAIASKFAAGLSSHGNIGERKYTISPVEPVPEEAVAVTTPQTASPITEPPAAGTTGSPTPYTPDYKGGLQPNAKPASTPEQTKTETPSPTPTASPVNPPATKAVTDAMANVGPPGPNQKDYRDAPAVKAEAAAKAPVPTETPSVEFDPIEVKQDEKPKEMKYGGSKQSPSGEPFVAVDTETGDHMFTFDKGEKVNFQKDGRIKVTPNTRRDSEEIEGLAKSRQDYMNNDARDRMIATSTQANQQATAPSSPVNNRNLQQMYSQMAQESMSTYKTPSAARAFKESRFQGRGDDPFALAPANIKT